MYLTFERVNHFYKEWMESGEHKCKEYFPFTFFGADVNSKTKEELLEKLNRLSVELIGCCHRAVNNNVDIRCYGSYQSYTIKRVKEIAMQISFYLERFGIYFPDCNFPYYFLDNYDGKNINIWKTIIEDFVKRSENEKPEKKIIFEKPMTEDEFKKWYEDGIESFEKKKC